MTLKVGIISANWGAMAHLPAWRSLPGVEVTSICTSRQETAEAAAERFGIKRPFWDAQAMCADPDLDIIDIGTRPILRHAMVQTAFANAKHVYNGIPCAANLDHARDMHRAWKASGKVGIVDAYSQWLPAHRLMREKLEEGFLGELFGGTCHFNISLYNRPHPQFPYNWFSQGGLGVSAVRNLGSHALHLLCSLFGEVTELVAEDRMLLREWVFPDGDKLIPENNDFANATLRFANGMTMQMQISWNATLGEGWLLDVFGSKGRMVVTSPTFPTSQDCVLRAGQLGGSLEAVAVPDRLTSAPPIAIDWASQPQQAFPMALAMQSMLDAIEGRGRAAPDFEQAWAVERIQEAIRLSSLERRWVRIAEIV